MSLTLAIEFSKADFPVTGLDIDQKQIDLLSEGKSYIKHIPRENIDFMNQKGGFRRTLSPLPSHSRPFLGCLAGTLSPTSLQIRATLL